MFFTSEKILKHKEKRSDMTSIANTVNKLL